MPDLAYSILDIQRNRFLYGLTVKFTHWMTEKRRHIQYSLLASFLSKFVMPHMPDRYAANMRTSALIMSVRWVRNLPLIRQQKTQFECQGMQILLYYNNATSMKYHMHGQKSQLLTSDVVCMLFDTDKTLRPSARYQLTLKIFNAIGNTRINEWQPAEWYSCQCVLARN